MSVVSISNSAVGAEDWWISFSGLAILGMTGAFYLLGAIADVSDPRRRR